MRQTATALVELLRSFKEPKGLIQQAAGLITNPAALKMQREHLASIDLKEALFTLDGEYFLEAVQYMIANHPFTEAKMIGETTC